MNNVDLSTVVPSAATLSPTSSTSAKPASSASSTSSAPIQTTGPKLRARSPKSSGRHIRFTLCARLYSWLESMAVLHNYGSVHKSIRDLLCWACTGQEEDYEWLFLHPHPHSSLLPLTSLNLRSGSEVRRACAFSAQHDVVVIDARVPDCLFEWVTTVAHQYHLPEGPSSVLDIVCKVAIELDADYDIFESNECGHDLAENTAELYHDLGLIRAAPNTHQRIQETAESGAETDVDWHADSDDQLDASLKNSLYVTSAAAPQQRQ